VPYKLVNLHYYQQASGLIAILVKIMEISPGIRSQFPGKQREIVVLGISRKETRFQMPAYIMV